jgi:hypothetical protein
MDTEKHTATTPPGPFRDLAPRGVARLTAAAGDGAPPRLDVASSGALSPFSRDAATIGGIF